MVDARRGNQPDPHSVSRGVGPLSSHTHHSPVTLADLLGEDGLSVLGVLFDPTSTPTSTTVYATHDGSFLSQPLGPRVSGVVE